jgi:MinD-like ATPase involved in chromosome partitioning or flagellar assembly
MEAINKGIPVSKVNSDSNIADNFRELANKISDEIIEKTILKYRGV